jgi:hypothetical protein
VTTTHDLLPTAAEIAPTSADVVPDLKVGRPERDVARAALEEHLKAARLSEADFDQRCAACEEALTQGELLRVFADLPAPHPDLPVRPMPAGNADDDEMPLIGVVCAVLFLGLPVTVILGVAYGAWWSLVVPVALTVVFLYVEHLLTRTDNRRRKPTSLGIR